MADKYPLLTRGVKLVTEHIYDPLSSWAAKISGAAFTSEDLATPHGTFRVNITVPVYSKANSLRVVPLILPPFQENFLTGDAPSMVLREMMFSWDQRNEPYGTTEIGSFFSPMGRTMRARLQSKDITNVSAAADASSYDQVVHALEFDPIVWTGSGRPTPYAEDELNKVVEPGRSYAVVLNLPGITGATDDESYHMVTVSCVFSTSLVKRDKSSSGTQNIPAHGGSSIPPTVTIPTPAADTLIEADTATGVSTVLEKIDSFVRSKLRGGYTWDSNVQSDEALQETACYEVIAVPLLAGMEAVVGNNSTSPTPIASLPYAGPGPAYTGFADRRVIPLVNPLTIHHVLIAANYTSGDTFGNLAPTKSSAMSTVGVGIGAGLVADEIVYDQVALAAWTGGTGPGTADDLRIDKAYREDYYHWDLLSCPLVGSGGDGYFPQGPPIFAGESRISNPLFPAGTSGTDSRSSIGGAAPNSRGGEQFLEVRWLGQDSTGYQTWGNDETIVGLGGHYVFIYAKKHLI